MATENVEEFITTNYSGDMKGLIGLNFKGKMGTTYGTEGTTYTEAIMTKEQIRELIADLQNIPGVVSE